MDQAVVRPAAAARATLVAAFALAGLDVALFTALGPLLPRYAEQLSLGPAALGALTSAYALGAFAGAVPAGIVTERLTARRVVLAGVGVMAVSSVGFGLGRAFAVLVAARLAQGVASSLVWTGCLTVVSESVPSHRRGAALATVMSGAVAGSLAGPVIGAAAAAAGPGPVFTALAVAVCVLGAVATSRIGASTRSGQGLTHLVSAVRKGSVARAGGIVGVAAAVSGGLMLLGTLVLDARGLSSAAIATVFLASSAVQLAANPVAGRLADRLGATRPMRYGFAASALLLPLVPVLSRPLAAAVAFVVAGTAVNVVFVPATSWLAELSDRTGLSRALGFTTMGLFWAPGFMVGSLSVGALSAWLGRPATALVLSVACLAALVAIRAPGAAATEEPGDSATPRPSSPATGRPGRSGP